MAPTPLPSSTSGAPSQPVLPRDARLIALLLAASGAEDCEEGVVRMLVEFAHRYTGDVLSDSLMYAEHARSGASGAGGAAGGAAAAVVPSLEDVRLAVQARTEGAQVPKEFLLQLSTTVNATPLPPVPEVYGIRLPPAAQRLTAPNFSIVPRSAPLSFPGGGAGGAGGGDLEEEIASLMGGGAGGVEGSEGGSGAGGGLFGDDDDDEDEDEDDEEMEDVTAGIGGSGAMSALSGGGANGGLKRKAGDSDEEYD
ncbi:hypothetical protein JCM6882_006860 [Rhodosporidiobolus microsporus]